MPSAIAITAHYDDALIWAGGAIKRTLSLGWEWTAIAFCAGESNRREYFEDWCRSLDIRAVALSFQDHPDGPAFSRNDPKALREAVLRELRTSSFEWAFTHSLDPEGEYGFHPNHAEAALTVVSLCDDGCLHVQQMARFAYRRIGGEEALPSVASPAASCFLQLDYEELRWKADWCRKAQAIELRDPALGGRTWLEALSWPCPNPEAFTGEGLRLPRPFAARPGGSVRGS